jgi:hypothetical protein
MKSVLLVQHLVKEENHCNWMDDNGVLYATAVSRNLLRTPIICMDLHSSPISFSLILYMQ